MNLSQLMKKGYIQIDEIDENTSFNDNCMPFIMDRSHSVDIDELKDLALAEYYLSNR